jgi:hypothetical protein
MSHVGWDGAAGDEGPEGSESAYDGGIGDAGPRDAALPAKDGAVALPTEVDVLFMIDNSGSMAAEQFKLKDSLGDFMRILSTGRFDPDSKLGKPDFVPPERLHVGVVSSDMGIHGAMPQKGCGSLSFRPTERDPWQATQFLVKPLGDDGVLLTSTEVAKDGLWLPSFPGATPTLMVPGRPECASVSFPPGRRFMDFKAGDSIERRAADFSCVATLGKNGCGLEQQFESVLKALTPPDSSITFSASNGVPTRGQGGASDPARQPSGPNAGFLREDAVLVVIFLSDEEDCSLPDASRQVFDLTDAYGPPDINWRCGLEENQRLLYPISRYVDGLRALKPPAYRDRIIVASIVGMPVKGQGPRGQPALPGPLSGAAQIQAVLDRFDMQFRLQPTQRGDGDEPIPTCISSVGAGSATPGRRFLKLAQAFGDNGVVSSICDESYDPLMTAVVHRIAAQLGTR